LDAWAHRHGVKLAFSRPGTPTDNPFIETFNTRFREEARTTIEAWRIEYNTERRHTALHNQVPAAYRADCIQTKEILNASD
jgi:putative transposase